MTLSRLKSYILAVSVAMLAACSAERAELPDPVDTPKSGGVNIRLTTGEMLPQIVASRSDAPEQKTAEEKKINTVHLFFFDEDGEFLTATDKDNFAPYRHYDFSDGKQPYINIPGDVFTDQETLSGVQIYAAVNIEGGTFRTPWTPEGDIVSGHPEGADQVMEINRLSDLLSWVYRPTVRKDVSKLPEGGMPMVGKAEKAVSLAGTQDIDLTLKALMARVDAKVKLDGSQENHDDLLPKMQVTEYGVLNLPLEVPFFNDGATRTTCATLAESTVKVDNPVMLYDGVNEQEISYYTYENLRDGKTDFSYPDGVNTADESVTQRWKPRRAPDKGASALVLRGEYWTHQDLHYQADFKFFLGSNTVDNFEVFRNRRYINNVTISGLEYVRNSDENVFTFDARVNVTTDNPVFISIVNERRLDSHWCVLPMDIYFLENAPEGASVEIAISDGAKDWISLEYCDASQKTESDFKAGWGCRDYFTENMIAEVGGKSAVATHNRDRIYFYIDENASTKGRMAVINVTYKASADDPAPRERTIEFEQAGLLPFTYNNTTYYMESYEEYDEHYDPLDGHGPSPWYQPAGIPWAAEGSPQNKKAFSDGTLSGMNQKNMRWSPFDVINGSDGQTICQYIMGIKEYSGYSLSSQHINLLEIYPKTSPSTAIGVACSKNKKNSNFSNQALYWFLPTIEQLGAMMKSWYNVYPSFKELFYWSANPARNPNLTMSGLVKGRENPERARATKLDANNNILPSDYVYERLDTQGWGYPSGTNNDELIKDYFGGKYSTQRLNYEEDGGRTLRTQPLRVRAIRTADGVKTN